jgi:predicted aminopeptidase
VVAPHTSNWDFVVAVLGRPLLGLEACRFLAKKSLFQGPFGRFFYWLGGTPVDRSRNMNLVDQVVEKFDQHETFAIAVTPEGTRSYIPTWKTGFYYIALKARVPIVFGYLDFQRRVVGVGEKIYTPVGELEKDLPEIMGFYREIIPRYPENSTVHHGLGLKGRPAITAWKFLLKIAAIVTGVLALLNWELVSYGARQGYGQVHILMNAKPVAHYLEDPAYPDSLKEKILLIQQVRAFATDSIGLAPSGSYLKMFDQQDKPLMFVLTACEPFRLVSKQWQFPVLGTFSYKGFFNETKARKEEEVLREAGWDTRIRQANGWSTLGILNDPILSNMLYRAEGDLAELIIHELTHGTIFVKNNLELNENIAVFIGEEGAKWFLKSHYGEDHPVYQEYVYRETDAQLFIDHVLAYTATLDSLYQTFDEQMDEEEKKDKKNKYMLQFSESVVALPLQSQFYRNYFATFIPNNAFFMGFVQYHGTQDDFHEAYEREFGGNLRNYVAHLKAKYPSFF